jgi:ClpP class serine protease
MAGVAASGGYYVAAGANKIVAQPGTLTGSIGIVFSQPNIQGLLARLGIATETLDRGRYARLFDASKGWSAAERQQVQRLLETLYRTFIRKVAEGRSLSVDEVDRLGRGRVWTGAQAHAYGLVDQLGGLETALRLAKEAAGIPTEASTQLVFYPTTESWLTTLVEFWRTQTGTLSALPQPLREFVRSLAPFVGQGYGPLLAPPFLLQVR